MKIFRWVHRKFYQRDGLFDRNVKKDDQLMINHHDEIFEETQLLLQDATFAHMLDGWNGGILAIGTVGLDPHHQGVLDNIEDEQCKIIVSDLLNPLMYANGHAEQCHMALNANVINDENKTSDQSNKLDSKKQSIKKERITLADLFSADSSDNKENSPAGDSQSSLFSTKKASNGLCFAKKLIPGVREDSRPILKLQLMTRVLKRKVHPDMRSKNIHKNSQVNMLEHTT